VTCKTSKDHYMINNDKFSANKITDSNLQ